MRWFIAATAVLLLATAASAAKPSEFAFYKTVEDIQQPVEQQSPNFFYNNCGADPNQEVCDPSLWVTNPTGCNWDVDDYTVLVAGGVLRAGASAQAAVCMVADGFDTFGEDDHRLAVTAAARSDRLVLTLTSSTGVTLTAAPTAEGIGFRYLICTRDETNGPFADIPGSNGGTGRVVEWTATLSNPSARNARSVSALMQTGFTGPYQTGC